MSSINIETVPIDNVEDRLSESSVCVFHVLLPSMHTIVKTLSNLSHDSLWVKTLNRKSVPSHLTQ